MARAVLGPILQDLRGKLGNAVYDNYKGVHIVRSMPSYINNPQSEHQILARAAMTAFVEAWKGLTLDQKQLWNVLSVDFIRGKESDARMNRGGLISLPRGPFSGYNTFIACNMNRYSSGYSAIDEILEDAPIGKAKPDPVSETIIGKTGRQITYGFNFTVEEPREERVVVWIRSIDAGIHPQIIYTEARDDGNTISITEAKKTSGIWVTLPNGVYQLQTQITNQYGLTSPPSELMFIQLGGADTYTYLTPRVQVLDLNAQAGNVGITDIDLSGEVPEGAHSAIILAEIIPTALGGAGLNELLLCKSAAQGVCVVVTNIQPQNDQNFETAIMAITSDRKIRYAFNFSGAPAAFDLNVWLLGYIE